MKALADMTIAAETDVREYLLGAKTAFSASLPFFPALRQYAERFSQQYRLQVELSVPPELETSGLAPAVEMQLLRITQEALSNARKHAHATDAQIIFTTVNRHVQITIRDNGQGFDPDELARHDGGYGLRCMRERAEGLGGTLRVESAPGEGTCVRVEMPMMNDNEANYA